MKKVGFITIHAVQNFGSILQTIATAQILKELGCQPILINYIPKRYTWKRFFKHYFSSLSSLMKMFVMLPVSYYRKRIFNSYLQKYVTLSKPIYQDQDFCKVCPKLDVYMTGSDQVWNSIHNEGIDKHYYFDGFPESITKIAYSASIGQENISPYEFKEVKRMLGSYKTLSVREESARKLLETMGYNAVLVLDPTFMLNAHEWKSYMSKRTISQPYLLVYLPYDVPNKQMIYGSIRRIANRYKWKVVTFSKKGILKENCADQTVFFANPGDFLSLMYYASFVVTTSFHGTSFCINLNKQFFVYLPTSFETRITSILDMCSLRNRLLNSNKLISDEQLSMPDIDYTPIMTRINQERKKSMEFLRKALSD